MEELERGGFEMSCLNLSVRALSHAAMVPGCCAGLCRDHVSVIISVHACGRLRQGPGSV